MEIDENAVVNETILYWSNASTWPSGKVPEEGEEVHIDPTMNVVLDVDTPKLSLLRINGRLTFLNTSNIHLQAEKIFIRKGELHIGSPEHPYIFNATITLYGGKTSEHFVFSTSIDSGNKMIANIGTLRMYGRPRR